EAAAEKGIQPIIGCTLKVDLAGAPAEAALKPQGQNLRHLPSLALLAKNATGYQNLMKLSSRAYLDSGDAEPHVPLELLESHHQGLICLTGGPAGPINEALVQNQSSLARAHTETLLRIFGDRLYIELPRHGP